MHRIPSFQDRCRLLLAVTCLLGGLFSGSANAQKITAAADPATTPAVKETEKQPLAADDEEDGPVPPPHVFKNNPPEPARLPEPKGLKAMPKPHRVWINMKKKQVIVDGYVSLDEGLLEMFACGQHTKEHESIVAVHSNAKVIHAALLAVGAKVGHAVQWDPEFKPPAGTEIEIEVRWLDDKNEWKSQAAQEWIYDVQEEETMQHRWVFAGSRFWKDEETGKEFYSAESGDLICVSNFSSAMLDIPVESSQANNGLLFEAYKKNIPAVGTPVRLVLKPKFPEDKKNPKGKKADDKKAKDQPSKDKAKETVGDKSN